jgi:gamma-glutamylcyclotransferase (GGCT)/AIG2-like uncharacterized protein YtfP
LKRYIDKIKQLLSSLPAEEELPFAKAKVEDISTDTLRVLLHRLHDRGEITITKRGFFKIEKEPFREYLFVYGSLKKGFDNHHLLSKYTQRIGKSITIDKFAMYEDSFGNYPYLTPTPIYRIHGELYLIQRKELLEKLDKFEGSPEYFIRKKIFVKSHKGVIRAYVYMRTDVKVSDDAIPLRVWENDTALKTKRLQNYFDKVLEDA